MRECVYYNPVLDDFFRMDVADALGEIEKMEVYYYDVETKREYKMVFLEAFEYVYF